MSISSSISVPEPRAAAATVRARVLRVALVLGACVAAASPARAQAPVCEPTHTIAGIQGSDLTSPAQGAFVITSGIVTGRYTSPDMGGFFAQMAADDGDTTTSNAVFVFTGGGMPPPEDAVVGSEVCVEGYVSEFSDGSGSPSTTMVWATYVWPVRTGRPLPAPVDLPAAALGPTASRDALEPFEGMRVRVASLTVVAPTEGIVDASSATSTSTGVFYGVAAGVARPFREPGVDVRDVLPEGSPTGIPVFDSNPERLRIDSAGLGSTPIDVAAGATVTNVVGPLGYGERTNTILVDTTPGITPGPAASAVPAASDGEFTVASLSADRLFDSIDDPGVADDVASPAAVAHRLAKLSLQVRGVLRTPDVLAVLDVETLALLESLAARINADAVAAGQPDPGYQAYLVDGQDPAGLDSGVLIKSSRVALGQVSGLGAQALFYDPWSDSMLPIHHRLPLAVEASVVLPSGTVPVRVLVTHLRSGAGSAASDGVAVRAQRAAQAESIAGLVQELQNAGPGDALVVVGDFGGVHFNDGWVDAVGTVAGVPVGPSAVVQATSDLVDPNLADALASVDAGQRYTVTETGNAQAHHHVLVNAAAAALQSRAAIAHANADFPGVLRNDPVRAERAAAADVPVVYFGEQTEPPPPPPPTSGPREVTSQVRVKVWRSSHHHHRHYRGLTFLLVDVTNTSKQAIAGPFHLGIGGLPDGASVANARGTIAGLPAVPAEWWRQLRPGRTMRAWVVLKGTPRVTPTIRVFAGKARK